MTEPNPQDVKMAVAMLKSKRVPMDTLEDYYNGDQPLQYSTERLKELFSKLKIDFKINWCSVVIDTILDRLSLTGWRIGIDQTDLLLSQLFDRNHLNLISQDIHRNALIKSEAYVIVEEDENNNLAIYFNDPSQCHLFFDPENPSKKLFGVKSWLENDGSSRLNLYYPDETHRYIKSQKKNSFVLMADGIQENRWGRIPMFQFKNSLSGKPFSELKKVISIQDAVNKLFADLMVSSEFNTFRQKYAITNSDTDQLSNEPNSIWTFFPSQAGEQQTQVGQFEATGLAVFLEGIEKLTYWASVITRTPKHYFTDAGSAPSGESLMVMEAPLVKKVQKYIDLYSVTWEEIAEFCLQVKNISVSTSQPEETTSEVVQSTWDSPESALLETQMNIIKTGKEAGIPVKTMLRKVGWDDKEITEYEKDLKEQKKADTTEAKLLLDEIRKDKEQNNDLNGNESQIPPTTTPPTNTPNTQVID